MIYGSPELRYMLRCASLANLKALSISSLSPGLSHLYKLSLSRLNSDSIRLTSSSVNMLTFFLTISHYPQRKFKDTKIGLFLFVSFQGRMVTVPVLCSERPDGVVSFRLHR